uniref:DUF932 domain-containing protein n=1 Tax=viral metagenome TaxID=1070528 RepID=A0A6M3L0T3_9ZZZZ
MIELIENETRDFKSLKSIKEFLKEQDSRKKEKLVQFSDWEMTEHGLRIRTKKDKHVTFPMRDSGMKTLLRTFQMPTKFYYSKSPTDMVVRDINRMRDEYSPDSEFIVYLQKPEDGGKSEVRAISKPSIKHLTTHEVLLNDTPISKNIFNIASYSDLGIRITTSDDSKPIKVEKGDIVNIGMELMYSDVGYFPVSGYPYLNRLVCTNGMVMREKNPLLNGFSMSYLSKMTEDVFLDTLNHNIGLVEVNAETLKDTFKIMKDTSISKLPLGEIQMKKIRNAIGVEKFDGHEKLTTKIMDEDEEKRMINTDLDLYTALDITTRLSKEYDYLHRRRIETLAGSLVLMSADLLR